MNVYQRWKKSLITLPFEKFRKPMLGSKELFKSTLTKVAYASKLINDLHLSDSCNWICCNDNNISEVGHENEGTTSYGHAKIHENDGCSSPSFKSFVSPSVEPIFSLYFPDLIPRAPNSSVLPLLLNFPNTQIQRLIYIYTLVIQSPPPRMNPAA
ncbi:hypothetical protein Tco_0247717 [Tanacetum coccineum]